MYQTLWFKILCGGAITLALFMLVQLRVKNVAGKVRLRQAAQHAERERIARELHDTFLQSVQGLIIKFASVTKKIPKESPLRKTMEELLDRSDDVVEEARSSIQNLREREKNTLQLPEKLALLAEGLSGEHGIAVNVSIQGKPYELVVEIYENIYAIAQEAIRNAGKHSFAKNVEIEVNYGTDVFRLSIRDDGRGMDDKMLTQGRHRHWGLLGMRERAKLINGRLKIVSRLSGGTEVELSVLRRFLAAGDIKRSAPWAEQ
jgi:signal transduction histidine kinase